MATGGVYGGYNYNFVDGDPPSKYICTICTLVARDPQQTNCCFNILCKSCILQLNCNQQSVNCPICREPLTGNYFKDGIIEREIQSLRVYCTNTDSGCQWVGTINDIEAHLNSCPYQLIPCTNECGENIRRSTLETHLTENCPKRLVNCQYCEEEGTHQLITTSSHLDECLDYPLSCGCGETVIRRSIESHNQICSQGLTQCQYTTIGCRNSIRRDEVDLHNRERVSEHLRLAINIIETLKSEVKALKLKTLTISSKNDYEYIKMKGFSRMRENQEDWYSHGFYTSPGGYKMTLCVIANGSNDGRGTHTSCCIRLLSGECDDTLEWPFQGKVTIELLNQLKDESHKVGIIQFNGETATECSQRVREGNRVAGLGIYTFISHSELEYNPNTNCQYLKDDSLYFRVSVKAISTTRPWLVASS